MLMTLFWIVYFIALILMVVVFVYMTIRHFVENNESLPEIEKAREQRKAVENDRELFFKLLDMDAANKIPKRETPEWEKLFQQCAVANKDFLQHVSGEKVGLVKLLEGMTEINEKIPR